MRFNKKLRYNYYKKYKDIKETIEKRYNILIGIITVVTVFLFVNLFYMLQLNFYKALIELSPKYRNYKVLRGHILFVTKDPNDEMVHDRLYEYNDTDWTLFKDLLKSVYHQITTLDFINNPEIMITPDKERSMRDIKEFITLLLA